MKASRGFRRGSIASTLPILACSITLGSLLAGYLPLGPALAATKPSLRQKAAPTRATARAGSNGYVGSAACARCHALIAREFSRTPMGRSLIAVTPETIRTLSLPLSIYVAQLDRHFEVFTRSGKLY